MTALAHAETFAPMTSETDQNSLTNGSGLEIFTTGLASQSTDMMAGDGVEMGRVDCADYGIYGDGLGDDAVEYLSVFGGTGRLVYRGRFVEGQGDYADPSCGARGHDFGVAGLRS